MVSQRYLQPPKSPYPLNIPPSSTTVKVSIIDSTSYIRIPSDVCFQPSIQGFEFLDCPAFSFLIQHPSGRTLLFDLGIRKDWRNLAPKVSNRLKENGWDINVEKDVVEILEDYGVRRGSVEGIVWSHWHWDHTGAPSTFPSSTSLMVGPGFTKAFMPGYPSNPEAFILEADYEGRKIHEISFSQDLTLGRFPAYDYFGDGSFYLLNSPGHAIGHMCGLARTTTGPDTFIFMGGDACHHGGEFRPTQYLPLPTSISPSPLSSMSMNVCPGAIFEAIHRHKRADEPFLEVSENLSYDRAEATECILKVEEFDGNDDVFTVIAHDMSLKDVVDFFPKQANDWKSKEWGINGRWRFLQDFMDAIDKSSL
ncbi:hypothetical protein MMC14_004912 [Varicellaria rhodocarpa]|nr:hypothetical protein [Varicellaria rhodocarpa]